MTRHARSRMRWHAITPGLIEHALLAPDWRGLSGGGRMNRCERVADPYLRVIEYDPEVDAPYIQIREARADDNIDIEDGVTVDIDTDRHFVGVEIPDASKRPSPSDLWSITIQKLPLEAT